jgi:hypothetical protein
MLFFIAIVLGTCLGIAGAGIVNPLTSPLGSTALTIGIPSDTKGQSIFNFIIHTKSKREKKF